MQNSLHIFGDNDSSFDYGWEYDLLLRKKWTDDVSTLFLIGYYNADNFSVDTLKAVLSLAYQF